MGATQSRTTEQATADGRVDQRPFHPTSSSSSLHRPAKLHLGHRHHRRQEQRSLPQPLPAHDLHRAHAAKGFGPYISLASVLLEGDVGAGYAFVYRSGPPVRKGRQIREILGVCSTQIPVATWAVHHMDFDICAWLCRTAKGRKSPLSCLFATAGTFRVTRTMIGNM